MKIHVAAAKLYMEQDPRKVFASSLSGLAGRSGVNRSLDWLRKWSESHLSGFNSEAVLFKPTLACVNQFRGSKREARSDFIGQGPADRQRVRASSPY